MLPRERKTANCFEALEATHNHSQLDRRPMADEVQLRPQRTALRCQATAGQQHGCHRACKPLKPPHNKATPVTMGSRHSDHCSRRAPHSQPDTMTSPVSRIPTTRSPQQSSAVSRWREIQPLLRNSSQMFPAPTTAKLLLPIIRRIHGLTFMGKVAWPFSFG